MSAREFRVGELVDVTIRGARVERVHDDGLRLDVGGGGINIPVVLPSASASITTERVAPAWWPPQCGDLWRDRHGMRWFAQDDGTSDVTPPTMWMVPERPERGGEGIQAHRWMAERGPVELEFRTVPDPEPDGEAPALHIRQIGAYRHNLCPVEGGEATHPGAATCEDCKAAHDDARRAGEVR